MNTTTQHYPVVCVTNIRHLHSSIIEGSFLIGEFPMLWNASQNNSHTISHRASYQIINHCCVHGLSLISSRYQYVCCVPRYCEIGSLKGPDEPYLCRELQARQRLCQMSLKWACHDEHESLGIAAERVLK